MNCVNVTIHSTILDRQAFFLHIRSPNRKPPAAVRCGFEGGDLVDTRQMSTNNLDVISLAGVQVPTVFSLKRANGVPSTFCFKSHVISPIWDCVRDSTLKPTVDFTAKTVPAILPSDRRGNFRSVVSFSLWIPHLTRERPDEGADKIIPETNTFTHIGKKIHSLIKVFEPFLPFRFSRIVHIPNIPHTGASKNRYNLTGAHNLGRNRENNRR